MLEAANWNSTVTSPVMSLVGARVGRAVGRAVGTGVGVELTGAAVGWDVVGTMTGASVTGASVTGARVGRAVGSGVGLEVGAGEGSATGSLVGLGVGARVGSSVGLGVGARVGARVVGTAVGLAVTNLSMTSCVSRHTLKRYPSWASLRVASTPAAEMCALSPVQHSLEPPRGAHMQARLMKLACSGRGSWPKSHRSGRLGRQADAK